MSDPQRTCVRDLADTSRRPSTRRAVIALATVLVTSVLPAWASLPDVARASTATSARSASPDAYTQLVLLHGTKAASSAIPEGYDELKRPPWNALNHYEILSDEKLALAFEATTKKSLPEGSSLETTLLESGERGSRLKIEIDVRDRKGGLISKGRYKASKGARFMPVTLPYAKGQLVVALKIL